VHYAMEFLPQQNKCNAGDDVPGQILAEGKDVVVIGGGDTGSDCDGTSNRQGAKSLTQFELLPQPPDLGKYPRRQERPQGTPWPLWPQILRTSSSHEEGCHREWSILTKEFLGDDAGRLRALRTIRMPAAVSRVKSRCTFGRISRLIESLVLDIRKSSSSLNPVMVE